jgi:tRNA modification GTPase
LPSALDPIVALATPALRSALALVRLSSPDDPGPLLRAVCPDVGVLAERRPTLTRICDRDGEAIDRGLVTRFPAPRSATGEHVLEFSLHGNPLVARLLIEHLIALGARRAEAGEFSRRAVLNGRLGLLEAEAVGALVEAGSRAAVRAAERALGGQLRQLLDPARRVLNGASARLEGAVDFPEQVGEPDLSVAIDELSEARESLDGLLQRGRRQALWRDGLRVVLAGAPNAGKSTLFNRLCGRDRAITSAEPGTTRDLLEVMMGASVTLVDTAGLRSESAGEIEVEGQRRARRALDDADLLLWVYDGRQQRGPPQPKGLGAACWRIATHADRVPLHERRGGDRWVSGVDGEGVSALRAAIEEHSQQVWSDQDPGPVSDRQCDALERAMQFVDRSIENIRNGEWGLALVDAEGARTEMALLLGDDLREDVLDALFGRFCIGK